MLTSAAPHLALVAGEASGDLLAGLLLGGLKQRWPGLRSEGIGGAHMVAQGFQAWWPSSRLAVRGYVEVLRHYPGLVRLRNELGTRLLRDKPDAFIGVDAPDFNLGLETRLKTAGVRTIHFVCPSIWAWRAQRTAAIARAADHVLCLFPFEPALLAQHGIRASYVGHPLADAIPLQPPRDASRLALGLAPTAPVLALLPGSRVSEVEAIAPAFLRAAALMQAQRPTLRCVLPAAPGLRTRIEALCLQHAPQLDVALLEGGSHAVLAACDITLIASGTATLEAALFKRPMVIAYRMNALSWFMMKRQQLQPWVGLPNILCEQFVVPELIQERCEPAALARETLALLDDASGVQRIQNRFIELHHLLRQDTARKATDAIAQALQV